MERPVQRIQEVSGINKRSSETAREYIERVGDTLDVDSNLTSQAKNQISKGMFSPDDVDYDSISSFIDIVEEKSDSFSPDDDQDTVGPVDDDTREADPVNSIASSPPREAESNIQTSPEKSESTHDAVNKSSGVSSNFETGGGNTESSFTDQSTATTSDPTTSTPDALSSRNSVGNETINIGGESLRIGWVPDFIRTHAFGVVLAFFALYAGYLTLTLPINYGFDAKMYTEHARYYATTWHLGAWQPNNIHYDQSPVLRYTLYALVLKLTGIPDYNTSFRIGLFLTSIIYYVLSPYFLFKLIKDSASLKFAWAGLAGWIAFQVIQWPKHLMYAGKWQYCYVTCLVFAALYLANRSFLAADKSQMMKYAIGTAAVIGIAGLTQYIYTLVGVLAIVFASLKRRELTFLTVFSIAGLPFLVYAFIASSPEHFATTFSKTTSGSGGLKAISELVKIVFVYQLSSRLIVGSILLLAIAIAFRDYFTETLLFELTTLVSFSLMFLTLFTYINPGGLRYVIQFLVGMLGFTLLGHLSMAFVKEYSHK